MRFRHGGGRWVNRQSEPVPQVPMQNDGTLRHMASDIAQEAYKEYEAQFPNSQSFERLHERGGFGVGELAMLLYERIKRLESKP